MADRVQAQESSGVTAPRIARILEAAVRTGRPETARGGARLAHRLEVLTERLTLDLEAYLETQHCLCLHVTADALCADGRPARRRGGRQMLTAALLHAGGIVDIVFKHGVRPEEVVRFIGVLHRAPFGIDAAESIATMLWENDLQRIAFHCRDEFQSGDGKAREQFDIVSASSARVDELTADTLLDPVQSSAKVDESFPDVDLDATDSPLRRVFQEESGAAERLATRFPTTTGTLERLAELLTGVQLSEADAGTKTVARQALLRVVDQQLSGQHWDAVREVLRRLRPAAAHPAAYATLRALGAHVCGPEHTRVFAAVLGDKESSTVQVTLVHDILRLLGDDGVQPLWQHLGGVTDEALRGQDIEVLAALCADDPHTLVQHVNADAWESVRDCVDVLGRIGGARVLTHLGRWKRHADARVRLEVVRALLHNQQSGATTMLCDILDDVDARVRQSALWVLAERRDARALPKLRVMILEAPEFRERVASERDDFFRALGRLADEETLQELAGMLERRVWSSKGWPGELRRGAAIALGESNWPHARRLLDKHARSRDARLRTACRNALHGMQETRAVEATEHVG